MESYFKGLELQAATERLWHVKGKHLQLEQSNSKCLLFLVLSLENENKSKERVRPTNHTPDTEDQHWEFPSSPCTHLSVIFLAVCRNRAWSFSFRECSAWEMSDADRSMHCLQFAICWASLRSLITLNKSMERVTWVSLCSENALGWTLVMCAFCCM